MRFERIFGIRGYRWAILAVSLLYGWLCSSHLAIGLILTGLAYALTSASLLQMQRDPFAQNKAHWLGSAALALLFLAVLPIRALTDLDQLYSLAVKLALPAPLPRLLNLAENLLISGLTFLLAFGGLFLLWAWLRAARVQAPLKPPLSRLRTALFYALPCLLVWAVFLWAYWPGIMLPNSYTQWGQINDLRLLNDWHPVLHTLLQYALTRLWYSPAIVAIFQVLALALVWGACLAYFETRGLPRKLLFLLSCGFALLPYNGIQIITLVKDELYTVSTLGLLFLIGLTWASDGRWLARRWHPLLLGVALALPFLLRHNGLILLGLLPVALLVSCWRQRKAVLIATITAVLLIVVLRNGLAFGILKAQSNPASVMYEIPIQHISAVGYYGGVYTPEQESILQEIAPVATWREAYNPYNADYISKTWGVLHDDQISEKIDQNQSGLLRTFLALAVKYPGIMLRSELDLMSPVWAITFPDKEPSWHYKYSTASFPITDNINPAIVYQPNMGTPLERALHNYLLASNQPFTRLIFWHGGLYLFLTLAFLLISFFTRGRDSLLLFVISLGNVLSLFLAMPMQSFRYIYPYVACTFLLALFIWVGKEKEE